MSKIFGNRWTWERGGNNIGDLFNGALSVISAAQKKGENEKIYISAPEYRHEIINMFNSANVEPSLEQDYIELHIDFDEAAPRAASPRNIWDNFSRFNLTSDDIFEDYLLKGNIVEDITEKDIIIFPIASGSTDTTTIHYNIFLEFIKNNIPEYNNVYWNVEPKSDQKFNYKINYPDVEEKYILNLNIGDLINTIDKKNPIIIGCRSGIFDIIFHILKNTRVYCFYDIKDPVLRRYRFKNNLKDYQNFDKYIEERSQFHEIELNSDVVVDHDWGFYSNCSVRLFKIIEYFNKNKKLPNTVDSSGQFSDYKDSSPFKTTQERLQLYGYERERLRKLQREDDKRDYTFKFFHHYDNGNKIEYSGDIKYSTIVDDPRDGDIWNDDQFSNYKLLNFEALKPFINKYFSPIDAVDGLIADLEKKYNIDYESLTACYYRGTDKAPETNLIPFDQYIEKVKEVKSGHPETRFLFSTDEPEYRKTFIEEFPDAIIMSELLSDNRSFQHGLLMLANVIIMSKAKHIICTSGNVSMWVILYRGGTEGVYQYLSPKEIIYGYVNANYDPSQTKFWLP